MKDSSMKIFFLYSDEVNERFIEHLINQKNFCISCGEGCDDCRIPYGSYARQIVGVHQIPENLPEFIENPEEFYPKEMPSCDLVIAINLHHDLLSDLPEYLSQWKIDGLIVPIEDGKWVPLGLQKQVEDDLNRLNIQYSFPRPFCSLVENGFPLISEFIKQFKVGKPKIKINSDGRRIIDGEVEISSPCGCCWYLNSELSRYKPDIDETLNEYISKAHHSYPCNASMSNDIALGDAPLHIAGYIHRDCVYNSLKKNFEQNFDEKHLENFLNKEISLLKVKISPKF